MKTLEGQAALSYFNRLNKTLTESEDHVDIHSQPALISTIFRLEQAYLATIQPNDADKDSARITVTGSGFPSVPTSLIHMNKALSLHFGLLEKRKSLAVNWIETIMGLNPDQIRATDQALSQNENPYPKIASVLDSLSDKQIDYLFKSSRGLRKALALLPIYETAEPKWPGLLLCRVEHTPFFPDGKWDIVKSPTLDTFGRKYIDSTTFDPETEKVFGQKENPVSLDKPPLEDLNQPTLTICRISKDKIVDDSVKILPPKVSAWLQNDQSQEPKLTGIVPRYANKIPALASPDLLKTFLDIDFSNLPDSSSAYDIARTIWTVKELLDEIASGATQYATNRHSDKTNRQEVALKLTQTIKDVADPDARAAIQLAVWRQLEKHKDSLSKMPVNKNP